MKVSTYYLNQILDSLMKYGIKLIGISNITDVSIDMIRCIRAKRNIEVEIHKQIIDNLQQRIPYIFEEITKEVKDYE